MSDTVLRVGDVPGVTPDKWARSWRERRDAVRLQLVPVDAENGEAAGGAGGVDMTVPRVPVGGTGLDQVRLYDEVAVVVVARDHPVAAYEESELADLTGEQFIGGPPDGFVPDSAQLGFPPMSAAEAVGVAASGAG